MSGCQNSTCSKKSGFLLSFYAIATEIVDFYPIYSFVILGSRACRASPTYLWASPGELFLQAYFASPACPVYRWNRAKACYAILQQYFSVGIHIYDIRTKANIHTLSEHTNTGASVLPKATDPQVITGSRNSTIRLWDLAVGKSMATLTYHKKSVRAMALHPTLYMFASASTDNIKQWKCPHGQFIQNLSGHNAIVNALAANEDGVLVSGADNGSMQFWDWRTDFKRD